MTIVNWFFSTLKQYPEIAIFLTLAFGYFFGKFTFKGIGLGSVTATLLAGVVIGQIGITISQPLKASVFLMFLFAVGYAVGPQFVRGVAKDGLPQAIFAAVQCVLLPGRARRHRQDRRLRPRLRGGLYSGSQTISAAMGLSTDAINRLGLPADEAKSLTRLDADRLRGDLHVRHGRLGAGDRAARAEAAGHQSSRGVQGVRGKARRQRRSWAARARPGTAGSFARSA